MNDPGVNVVTCYPVRARRSSRLLTIASGQDESCCYATSSSGMDVLGHSSDF